MRFIVCINPMCGVSNCARPESTQEYWGFTRDPPEWRSGGDKWWLSLLPPKSFYWRDLVQTSTSHSHVSTNLNWCPHEEIPSSNTHRYSTCWGSSGEHIVVSKTHHYGSYSKSHSCGSSGERQKTVIGCFSGLLVNCFNHWRGYEFYPHNPLR